MSHYHLEHRILGKFGNNLKRVVVFDDGIVTGDIMGITRMNINSSSEKKDDKRKIGIIGTLPFISCEKGIISISKNKQKLIFYDVEKAESHTSLGMHGNVESTIQSMFRLRSKYHEKQEKYEEEQKTRKQWREFSFLLVNFEGSIRICSFCWNKEKNKFRVVKDTDIKSVIIEVGSDRSIIPLFTHSRVSDSYKVFISSIDRKRSIFLLDYDRDHVIMSFDSHRSIFSNLEIFTLNTYLKDKKEILLLGGKSGFLFMYNTSSSGSLTSSSSKENKYPLTSADKSTKMEVMRLENTIRSSLCIHNRWLVFGDRGGNLLIYEIRGDDIKFVLERKIHNSMINDMYYAEKFSKRNPHNNFSIYQFNTAGYDGTVKSVCLSVFSEEYFPGKLERDEFKRRGELEDSEENEGESEDLRRAIFEKLGVIYKIRIEKFHEFLSPSRRNYKYIYEDVSKKTMESKINEMNEEINNYSEENTENLKKSKEDLEKLLSSEEYKLLPNDCENAISSLFFYHFGFYGYGESSKVVFLSGEDICTRFFKSDHLYVGQVNLDSLPNGLGLELKPLPSKFRKKKKQTGYLKLFSGAETQYFVCYYGHFREGIWTGKGREFEPFRKEENEPVSFRLVFEGQFKEGKRHGMGEVIDYESGYYTFTEWVSGVSIRNCLIRVISLEGDIFRKLNHFLEPMCKTNISEVYLSKENWKTAHHSLTRKEFPDQCVVKTFLSDHSYWRKRIREFLKLIARLDENEKRRLVTICAVFGFEDTSFHFGYIMDKCEGDMGVYLETAQVDEEKKIQILEETAKGIEVLHNRSFFHRDLKWKNVFYLRRESSELGINVVIGDLDLAKEDKATYALTYGFTQNINIGTVGFNAPELIRNNDTYTAKVDIYSFGIMMFCILSGRQFPYDDGMTYEDIQNGVKDNKLRPMAEFPHVLRPMEDLMKKCWDDDEAKRPDIKEVIKTLGKFRSFLSENCLRKCRIKVELSRGSVSIKSADIKKIRMSMDIEIVRNNIRVMYKELITPTDNVQVIIMGNQPGKGERVLKSGVDLFNHLGVFDVVVKSVVLGENNESKNK